MVAALIRSVLRLHYHKRLSVDDAFLIFAVALACTSMGLYIQFMDGMYLGEATAMGRIPEDATLAKIEELTLRFHVLNDVFLVLTWTSIFAVKFSFLFFFRSLIDRIRSMEVLWRYVTAVTFLSWVVCVIDSIVSCPYFDLRSGESILLRYRSVQKLASDVRDSAMCQRETIPEDRSYCCGVIPS